MARRVLTSAALIRPALAFYVERRAVATLRPALVAMRPMHQRAALRNVSDVNAAQAAQPQAADRRQHDQQQQQQQQQQTTTEEEKPPVDDVKQQILARALTKVPTIGWTVDALTEAATELGLPEVAHGLFGRGAFDLVQHHISTSNALVVDYMQTPEFKELRTTAKIRAALRKRLELQQPVAKTWAQAIAIASQPDNLPTYLRLQAKFADDIWHHAGDTSVDFNWYTKRGTVAMVYTACEMFMIQDTWPDLSNTYEFLDRRLADAAALGSATGEAKKFVDALGQTLHGLFVPHKK